MSKNAKHLIAAMIGLSALLAIIAFVKDAHGQGGQYYASRVQPIIAFQNANPGWLPPGSIWIIPSNMVAFVQTNTFNTAGSVILTNLVISQNTTSTTVAGTNTFPLAGWATNTTWNGHAP